MKILMTADTVGGVWTYALDLVAALSPQHYKVTMATMGAPLTRTQWQATLCYPHLSVCESAYKLEWMDDPWGDVTAAGRWLLYLAQEFKPDLIHLNGYVHATLPWGAPVLVVGHSCVLSWWRSVKAVTAPAPYDTYRRLVGAGLHAAAAVVAPTHAMLTALQDEYGPLAQSRVIPNGRDTTLFAPAPVKIPLIFSIGRLWDEAKNVRALDEAASGLPWPVHVAGCSAHPAGHELALHHAHPEGVLTPPAVARWLARASIYALPARYEPFGLSVLEAALSECALVLGDIPSLRENWQGAALFVNPDDSQALHTALSLLINDPRLRAALGAAALRRAQRFTLAKLGGAYAQLYRDLCQEAAPGQEGPTTLYGALPIDSQPLAPALSAFQAFEGQA
ncbi:MAG: glycosyltransferase family 4 protein [Caldilineaceae bacterium]